MNMTDRSFQYSCVLSGCWDSVSLILFLVFIRGDESSCCVTSMSLSCFPSWLVSPGPDYPPCFHCSLVHCVNVSVLSWLSVFFLPVFLLSDACMFFFHQLFIKVCLLCPFIYSFFFFFSFFFCHNKHSGIYFPLSWPWRPGSWHCKGICFQTADEKNCLHNSSLSAFLHSSETQITCEDANGEFSASLNHFFHWFVIHIPVWIWSQFDLIYLFEKFNLKMSW